MTRSWRSLRWGLALVACGCLVASAAHAEPTLADKATARDLLLDGRAKMSAGDHAGALKAFSAAHAIMNVPTTGLDLATAQAALGLLVEARETALAVVRLPPKPGEAQAFADARKAADELARSLSPRIPSVVATVKGPPTEVVALEIDGVLVPPATLGLPRKVNPGQHRLVARAPGFTEAIRSVSVAEGQTVPVEISLSPLAPTPTTSATVTPTAPPATASVPSGSATAAPAAPGAPVWAWVSAGAGVIALGVGVGFLVSHLGVRDQVAADCPGNVCDPAKHDAASAQELRARWNRDLGVTVAMGALALAGAGVAIAGFTMSRPPAAPATGANGRVLPARRAEQGPRAAVRVHAGGLSIQGAF